MQPCKAIGLAASVIALFGTPLSQAAEWTATPRVSLKIGHNDNISMTSQPHDAVREAQLAPSIKFGVAKENSGLFGDAGFSIRRYQGGSGRESSSILDREDYHLRSNAYYNMPRTSLSADLDFTSDSTLDSELDQTGNVIEDRATRERIVYSPGVRTQLNELTELRLGYSYTNINYTEDFGLQDLVSYETHFATGTLARSLTPDIQATVSTSYSTYSPSTDFDSETIALQAGLDIKHDETLTSSFLVGRRKTVSDSTTQAGACIGANPGATFPTCTGGFPVVSGSADTELDTSSLTYIAGLEKTLENGLLRADLSRSSQPGGSGELLDNTRLILTGRRDLSETLESSVMIEYAENETIVNRVGRAISETEKFFRITPRLQWQWRRTWTFSGEYQYATNESAIGRKAKRNALYVSVLYTPTKWTLSR